MFASSNMENHFENANVKIILQQKNKQTSTPLVSDSKNNRLPRVSSDAFRIGWVTGAAVQIDASAWGNLTHVDVAVRIDGITNAIHGTTDANTRIRDGGSGDDAVASQWNITFGAFIAHREHPPRYRNLYQL